MELIVGGLLVVAGFLGWAFQGVGPSPEASAVVERARPADVPKLNGLLFGGSSPKVVIYCGARATRHSRRPC